MRALPLLRLVALAFPLAAALGACKLPDCLDDDACNGGFCVDGACVECVSTSDCGDGQACCQGTCTDAAVETMCGCAADPRDGQGGETCGAGQVCIAGDARATPETLADGACGCPCDATEGGSLCTVDDDAAGGFTCGCDRLDPVTTCEAPVLDDNQRPHRAADTCTPQDACVCFASGAPCLVGDCTAEGCVDLLGDPASCGVAGRSCTDEATGITDGGACLSGGCACNAASDCQGDALNVDSCQFVGDGQVTQCVCAGYRANELPAACPMGLACAQGGCVVAGTAYPDEAALLEALGVSLPAEAAE